MNLSDELRNAKENERQEKLDREEKDERIRSSQIENEWNNNINYCIKRITNLCKEKAIYQQSCIFKMMDSHMYSQHIPKRFVLEDFYFRDEENDTYEKIGVFNFLVFNGPDAEKYVRDIKSYFEKQGLSVEEKYIDIPVYCKKISSEPKKVKKPKVLTKVNRLLNRDDSSDYYYINDYVFEPTGKVYYHVDLTFRW